ncbi:MAG: ABC transporter substrate-binding protein [Chloroflexi bacterium]|nr:MAG: ABC transporter substrate-binding protein [Chloroflexota bacterium]
MKRTRFLTPTVVVLLALALILGACTQPATPSTPQVVKETVVVTQVVEKKVTAEQPAEKITLIITSGSGSAGSTKVLKKQIERYMQENPNVEVKVQEMPWSSTQQHDMYVTWAAGGLPVPDIYRIDIVWPPEFAAAGWILPLDEYIQKYGVDMGDFLPGPINGVTVDGKVYAMPYFTDAGLLYYRKDLLEKHGFSPPETFAELKEQALAIMEAEGIPNGFVWQGDAYEGLTVDFLEYVWGNCASVLDEKGNVAIDDPKAVEALQVMVDYIQSGVSPEGVTTYKEEDARNVFQRGDAVFMRNWPYAWRLLNKDDSPVKGKVGAKPMVHGEGCQSAAGLGGWNLAINSQSKHPEEAFKLIAYLTNPENQKELALEAGLSPVRKSLYQDPDLLAANPFYETLYDVFLNARPRPVHPRYPEISAVIFTEVHKALVGEQSPEEAIQSIAKQLQEIVGK